MKTGMQIEHETEPVKHDIYEVLQYICLAAVIAMFMMIILAISEGPHGL